MFNIVLFAPMYPGNVGNISRTCVLTNSRLHLIRPFKFDFSDKMLKRAGIDYWDKLELVIHESLDDFIDYVKDKNVYLLETGSKKTHNKIEFKDEDFIVFGREKEGLCNEIMEKYSENIFSIPMSEKYDRSLNLANSVSVVIYEALRQTNYKNL